MKNSIFRNGIYSTSFLIGLAIIPLLFLGVPGPDDFKLGEIIGYTSIVLAMVFVFFGIRQYRDEELGGQINFWTALKVGLAIAAFPALAFAIYNYIYVEFIDPDFVESYYTYNVEQAQNSMAPEQFAQFKANMENQMESFGNPWFQFGVMFLTVFLIGFVVSFISAFLLKGSGLVMSKT